MKLVRYLDAHPLLAFVVMSVVASSCFCETPRPMQCFEDRNCQGRPWENPACSEDEGHWECHLETCVETCGLECEAPEDCAARDWPEAECEPEDGFWTCEYGGCEAYCGAAEECLRASECEWRAWPEDIECAAEEGRWRCLAGLCEASCDPPQCEMAEDCDGVGWPDGIGCDADSGYFVCTDGACVAECDFAACTSAGGCQSLSWPDDAGCEAADGHWTCVSGACRTVCDTPVPDCDDAADCDSFDWPQDAGCARDAGQWQCQAGACVVSCDVEPACTLASDCDGEPWPDALACSAEEGHWTCPAGACVAECATACSSAQDCADAGDDWQSPCAGRWTCDGVCTPLCDYLSCGDGTCDPAVGEDGTSCAVDCLDTCQLPTDCVHEDWTQICQGRHTCFLGACQQTCDSNGCGNGVCDAALGETADSCFKDCLGGPCDDVLDCLGYRWYERDCEVEGGVWLCQQPAGACEASCDAPACGDGACDVLGGESATGCPDDCSQYDCDLSADCDGLTLPDACSSWQCVRRQCTPVCP